MSKLLEELKEKHHNLKAELSNLNIEIREEKLRIYELEYGISVDCIVLDKSGKKFKLSKIETRWTSGKPWVHGFKEKKNGDWSVRAQCIYGDWSLPNEV